MRKYKCSICEYVYDESAGIPQKNIEPGTKWKNLPGDFACPLCSAPKSQFKLLEEPLPVSTQVLEVSGEPAESLKELSAGEISAICSNLAKGCEKQLLNEEMEAFNKIADYFKAKTNAETGKTLADITKMLDSDITKHLPTAGKAANADKDRGALRALVWSEKISIITKALLERFSKEGDAMLENTKIWVCDACGFIYIGAAQPRICPVCKVPPFKIEQMERR